MWWTSEGERVLTGAEWELFRLGLSTLWDDVEMSEDEEDPGRPASRCSMTSRKPSGWCSWPGGEGLARRGRTLPGPDGLVGGNGRRGLRP